MLSVRIILSRIFNFCTNCIRPMYSAVARLHHPATRRKNSFFRVLVGTDGARNGKIAHFVLSIALLLCTFLLGTGRVLAVDYFYQSGDPTVLTNWNTLLGGGGATPGNFTTLADRFLIPNGKTVVLTSNFSIGPGVTLQVQTGGTLNGQTFAFAGGGDIDVQAGAFLISAHASGINGGIIQNFGARTYNATVNYTFNAAVLTQNAGFLPGSPITNAQSITLNNQNAPTAGTLVMDNGMTLTGAVTIQRGTLDCGTGLNHSFNGGANSVVLSPGTIFLRRSGTITAAAGTFQYQTGTPNAQLHYNAMATIAAGNEYAATMPGDVQIFTGTSLQLANAVTANGALTNNGVLNLGGFTLTQNGSFTAGAASTVNLNAGSFVWNGAITLAAGAQFQDNSGGGGGSLTLAGTGSIAGEFLWQGGVNNLGTLTLNRANATLTSSVALPISTLLSLQQGFLQVSQVRIESTLSNAIQGGSSSSFVIGQLLRRVGANLNGSPSCFFPVGRIGDYMPISVSDAVTGIGNPGIIVEARNGLSTGGLGTGVSSLSTIYWNIQPALVGDYSQIAILAERTTAPLLVSSSRFVGANATNATFSQINSIISGTFLRSDRFTVSAAGPSFFAIGNATPIPVITSFSPVTGGNATVATIVGANLSNATSVFFGNVPAQSFEVLSANVIRATVNNGETGFIRVATIGGTAFASTTFVYAPPPQITAITPLAGGFNTVVSLRGRNLSSTASVTFGGNVIPIIFRSDTLVQVRCPNRDVSGAIRLGTLGGVASTTSNFSFLFPPTISSFTPIVGTRFSVVTITGANFSIISSVTVGGAPVQSVTINSPTQISVALLDGATGPIVVRTPAGEATTTTNFFYAPRPTITDVLFNGLPTQTAVAGSTLLVRGRDLLFATRATLGVVTAAIVSVLSSTEMTIHLPLTGATTANLSISTPGGITTATARFEVQPALAITDVSPTIGTAGTLVQITGRNFTTGTVVSIAGTTASGVLVLSTTQILAVVGALPPRTTRGAIIVTSTLGTATTTNQFLVAFAQPLITSITPLSATFGSIVQVRGQFLTGVSRVSIGGGLADIVQSVSANELLVRVTRLNTSGTMTLTTPGGTTTSTLRMTIIPSPFILNFSPTFAVTGSTITVRGGNFTGTTSVLLGNTPAARFTVLSDSVLSVVVGTGSTGLIRTAGSRGTAQSATELRVLSRLEFETEILRVLYDSLGGSAWNNANRWLSADPPSEWSGITVEGGRITQIRLPDNNLRGRLPDFLGELTALRILDLTDNGITGAFPTWISRIRTLEEVRVGGNQFTGVLPDSVGLMPSLRVLVADRNRLSGALPQTLCSLVTARTINLNQNGFTGEIPSCLNNLVSLESLDLGQNVLSGTIPMELGDLTNLQSLYLHRNRLTGAIPASLGNATLAARAIAENTSKGSSSLTAANNLRRLWLGGNLLTGEVPESLRSLTALEELLIENNQLTGENVFRVLLALTNLQTLDIGRNRFTGALPSTLGNLRRLRYLSLRNNLFSGTLPNTLGNLDTLQTLLLDSNAFSGGIPAQLGALRNLQTLSLTYNRFTSLPRMSAILSVLAVQGNNLQFGDLQTNAAVLDFAYVPQDSLGAARDTGIVIGNPMLLALAVTGRDNLYEWFKNGVQVQATSSTIGFRVEQFSPQDTGTYTCAITNRLIDKLTLYSRPIRVSALEPRVPSQAPDLVFPQNGANFVSFSPTMQWTRVDNAIVYEIQASQLRDFSLLATTASVRSADTMLTTINTQLTALQPLTLYYWRVRALNGINVASPWSAVQSFITAPPGSAVAVSSVNFGNVVLGESVSDFAFLTNLTDADLTILDVDGNDGEFSFRIPLDVRGLRLRAGQTFSIRGIAFAPRSPGLKSATVDVKYLSPMGDTIIVRLANVLSGRGTPIKADSVNFDTIRTGQTAQTMAVISNRGGVSTRVIITGAEIVGNSNGFAVQQIRTPLYINSGASSGVVVTCSPVNDGSISATIRYIARFIQGTARGDTTYLDTLTARVRAFARSPLVTDVPISVGVRPARGQESLPPGSAVTMEVYVAEGDRGNLIQVSPLSYSTVIRFNRQVLAFGTNAPFLKAISNPDPTNNLQRIIVTAATVRSPDSLIANGVLFRFSCIAVAGDTTTTPIELEYFRFAVDTLPSTSVPQPFFGQRQIFVEELKAGSFTAKVSRAGGTRLIGRAVTSATLSAVQPNPIIDAGKITLTLHEETNLNLVLVDVFGRVVSILAEGHYAKGEYVRAVPIENIPTGTYFIVLRTPAAILTERVSVRR